MDTPIAKLYAITLLFNFLKMKFKIFISTLSVKKFNAVTLRTIDVSILILLHLRFALDWRNSSTYTVSKRKRSDVIKSNPTASTHDGNDAK